VAAGGNGGPVFSHLEDLGRLAADVAVEVTESRVPYCYLITSAQPATPEADSHLLRMLQWGWQCFVSTYDFRDSVVLAIAIASHSHMNTWPQDRCSSLRYITC
jgi:hypothetical protein